MIPLKGKSVKGENFLFPGASPVMEEVKAIVERVADTDLTVLIQGESGTGKGLLAEYIHTRSSLRNGPFVTINCAAVPGELLESELSESEVESFTGKSYAPSGKFKLAQGGTIFLDDIDEMEAPLQARLLAVLRNRRPSLPGNANVMTDVRIIASTRRDLKKEMVRGSFRRELYDCLETADISLPPLRERREDIPRLVSYFSQQCSRRYQRKPIELSARALELFQEYSWPGNVRELENAVKLAVILEDETAVVREISNRKEENNSNIGSRAPKESFPSLKEIARKATQEAEKEAILKVLDQTDWNRRKAARFLGISYKAFLYKMKSFAIKRTSP